MPVIREELPKDAAGISVVLEQAFGRPEEARLVEALRRSGAVTLSLVAVRDNRIVGHILFTPVIIEPPTADSPGSTFSALGLGPMAVLPAYQNRGIGSRLARTGLQKCHDAGHQIVVVLGHPNYYPRFGFTPAGPRGIRCEYDVPDEAFLVKELQAGALAGRGGVVRYRTEFGNV